VPDHVALAKLLKSNDQPNGILFVLFIPSKDKNSKPLNDQDVWSRTAAKLLTSVFGGATVMPAAVGMWLNDETNKIVEEEVVLIHSYAQESDVNDEGKLRQLAKFLHGMGKETNQGEVGLVIDDRFHRIRKYSLA
jgi:hypothetical protein